MLLATPGNNSLRERLTEALLMVPWAGIMFVAQVAAVAGYGQKMSAVGAFLLPGAAGLGGGT